jgi:hypothetical protein
VFGFFSIQYLFNFSHVPCAGEMATPAVERKQASEWKTSAIHLLAGGLSGEFFM